MKTMHLFHLQDLQFKIEILIQQAKQRKIFLYPTDTIYGIGGIVHREVIKKINNAKQRLSGKHYSIIAPSFSWIKKHFKNTENIETQWQKRQSQFPGRGLTLLLKPNNEYQKQAQLLSSNKLVGVRIIQSPFQNFITQLNDAFITTSANLSGQKNITKLSDIDEKMKKYVDYAIDGGVLNNPPSVVIDGTSGKILRK